METPIKYQTNATFDGVEIRPLEEVYLDDLELERDLLIQKLRRVEARLLKHGRISKAALRPSRRER